MGEQTWQQTCRTALEGALVEVVPHAQDSLQQVYEALAAVRLLTRQLQHLQLLPHLQCRPTS